ncbi:hypothetical protein IX314_000229 [Fusobacterium sp. DD26]|uniref:hypothetical protein n=1 Tax=unclassified Fusobacterium TaxID=2648384 RepID=UPI001B8A9FAA|nr:MULTISPECIES: hypothetical protein [unclassified Fusobacterium]MBR8700474.1 hypothetical protein [Fusobacterium sp. DD45]MBR8710261.1 hypothetical protein [Fusobacterium sp. DD28]MBR8750783.1 hypothetical protein [Fusobacterium sp. DD26]
MWKKIIVSYNNIKKISYYYNNGILKKTVTLKNDILVGKIKKYTSLGYLITDSYEYPNPLEKKKSKKLKIKKKKKHKKEKENLV